MLHCQGLSAKPWEFFILVVFILRLNKLRSQLEERTNLNFKSLNRFLRISAFQSPLPCPSFHLPLELTAGPRLCQLCPVVWKSPACCITVVLALIMLTAGQLSLTAPPRVYRALIMHLDCTVNQEKHGARTSCSKTALFPNIVEARLFPFFCCLLGSLNKPDENRLKSASGLVALVCVPDQRQHGKWQVCLGYSLLAPFKLQKDLKMFFVTSRGPFSQSLKLQTWTDNDARTQTENDTLLNAQTYKE